MKQSLKSITSHHTGLKKTQTQFIKIFRPPSGMPNPRHYRKMDFLSVPTIVHMDEDSMSSVSADTTTIFTKSSCSSTTNLNSMEIENSLLPSSLPNRLRSLSKEDKVKETGLDDIEESPTPTQSEETPTPTITKEYITTPEPLFVKSHKKVEKDV